MSIRRKLIIRFDIKPTALDPWELDILSLAVELTKLRSLTLTSLKTRVFAVIPTKPPLEEIRSDMSGRYIITYQNLWAAVRDVFLNHNRGVYISMEEFIDYLFISNYDKAARYSVFRLYSIKPKGMISDEYLRF